MENSRLRKMYQDMFASRGCSPCGPLDGLGPEGRCFSIDPEYGEGWCWVYQCGDHATITLMDQAYSSDRYCKIMQPDFLCIGYYYSVSGEQVHPYRKLSSNTFHAHVGKAGRYGVIHHRGVPLKSISITLMPEYYERHLQAKYADAYVNPKDAFACIDGIGEFPELLMVFNQIRSYTGTGMPARLYYEGKLDEALALVLNKSRETATGKPAERRVSLEDRQTLAAVASYIDNHYMTEIPQAILAQIACMSPAKLKYAFRAAYGCSLSEYTQNRRVGHAEHLLTNTDLSVAQIALVTGYKKPGSLTEVFKKHTGMTPSDYRRMLAG